MIDIAQEVRANVKWIVHTPGDATRNLVAYGIPSEKLPALQIDGRHNRQKKEEKAKGLHIAQARKHVE